MIASSALRVAYQGEPGAYSEAAAHRLFPDAELQGHAWFDGAFEAVVNGEAAHAVVPIENTLFGSVHPVYDLLQRHPLALVAEAWHRVQHCLVALPGTRLEVLREVRSHPQALGQCAAFLRDRLPQAIPVAVHDTAGAARMVRDENRPDVAAIASRRAATVYGLNVLAEGVETHPDNFTRFVVLAAHAAFPAPGVACKTSVVFSPRPDGLLAALAAFGTRGIAVVRVECRPREGHPFQHAYFADVAGAAHDPPLQQALAELEHVAEAVRVLGCYPAAALPRRILP